MGLSSWEGIHDEANLILGRHAISHAVKQITEGTLQCGHDIRYATHVQGIKLDRVINAYKYNTLS